MGYSVNEMDFSKTFESVVHNTLQSQCYATPTKNMLNRLKVGHLTAFKITVISGQWVMLTCR